MQVAFPSSPPAKCIGDDQLADISMELSEDLSKKLGFLEEGEEIGILERSWSKLEESVEFVEEEAEEGEKEEDDEEGDEEGNEEGDEEGNEEGEKEEDDVEGNEEGEEFSFACVNAEGSPITADEAFEDGQIRPVFPLFNRDLLFDYETADQNDSVSVTDGCSQTLRPRLRKLFVEDRDGDGKKEADSETEPLGPYCSWSGGTVEEASLETCRKSNSTGFSKLWRFRDLVSRSNSDGRDAFVFLKSNVGDKTQSTTSSSAAKLTIKKPREDNDIKTEKGKDKTTSSEKKTKSAHETLYMRNRAMKEEGKHRSYLPYKQVGFFTNVNGLSRNIHPF